MVYTALRGDHHRGFTVALACVLTVRRVEARCELDYRRAVYNMMTNLVAVVALRAITIDTNCWLGPSRLTFVDVVGGSPPTSNATTTTMTFLVAPAPPATPRGHFRHHVPRCSLSSLDRRDYYC